MTDPKLKSLVERAEKIIEERKAVSGDLRDIFSEAKGVGYEPRFVRKIIAERAMDAADLAEQEAVMDAYRHALGMVAASVSNGDMSLRQAAKESGFSKSAIQRVSHQMRDSVSGTVEMTEDDLGRIELPNCGALGPFDACDFPNCDCHTAEDPEPIREMVADDLGDPLLVIDKPRAQFREKVRAAVGDRPFKFAPPPQPTVLDDNLEIPPFLRRVPA